MLLFQLLNNGGGWCIIRYILYCTCKCIRKGLLKFAVTIKKDCHDIAFKCILTSTIWQPSYNFVHKQNSAYIDLSVSVLLLISSYELKPPRNSMLCSMLICYRKSIAETAQNFTELSGSNTAHSASSFILFTSNKSLHFRKSVPVFILVFVCFLLSFSEARGDFFWSQENYLAVPGTRRIKQRWGRVKGHWGRVNKMTDKRPIQTQTKKRQVSKQVFSCQPHKTFVLTPWL